jgi:DNA replication protein DnaC
MGPKTPNLHQQIMALLKELRMPAIRENYQAEAQRGRAETLSYEEYLLELLRREAEVRRENRIRRNLLQSKLPLEKNLTSFDLKRLPLNVQQKVKLLLEGSFLDRRENVLLFGNPGSGKSHLICAVAQELIYQDRRVLFNRCDALVQDLLVAKQELKLNKLIKRMTKFDALLIDDIGYVQQNRDEMEVLFTLLAECYERTTIMLTSNLPFSKWEQIFKDPMTTVAAIDRMVHHSIILELNVKSYRMEQARKKKQFTGKDLDMNP